MRALVFETSESATLRYQLNEIDAPKDITGMTFRFAAKVHHTDATYAIEPVVGVVDDAAGGKFSFELTMPPTPFAGLYSVVMEDGEGNRTVLGHRPGDVIRVGREPHRPGRGVMDCTVIQQAVISAIRAGGTGVRQVEASGHGLPDAIASMPLKLPAVFVDCGKQKYRRLDGSVAEVLAEFVLHVALAQGTQGAGEIADAVLGAVSGSTLGLSIEPITPVRSGRVNAPSGIVLFEAVLGTSYDLTYE